MPRNPGAKKNQHNNRHENGLVGPGKRITKEKSNGQLNGSPKGPEEPLPTGGVSENALNHHTNDLSSSSESKQENPSYSRPPGLRMRDSDSSFDVRDGSASVEVHAAEPQEESRQPPEVSSSKAKAAYDLSHLQIASTILKSSPASDTVAILIFLLALPSMVLTIVQALFASLTLMPPHGVTPGSLLSLFDIFQGSAGSPSIWTMISVDAICFGLWFCLWNWAQNFALDLAQVQIAITLGNGNTGRSSTVNSFCVTVILLLHSIRSKGVRQFVSRRFLPSKVLSQGRLANIAELLPSESDFGETVEHAHWLRSLFAIHILSQALMAFVRRRVANSQSSVASKPSKKMDTEAGQPIPESSNIDGNAVTVSASGVDYQPPPTPGLKDGKEKVVTAKKKRRQANQVRSRQPFWAAVASTKVHVLREYEHKRGLTKTSNNQDGFHEPSATEAAVWVTQVDPFTIQFEANNIHPVEQDQGAVHSANQKPFFVRINGAKWLSVSLDPMEGSHASGDYPSRWIGEIPGLAPNCTYTCSFIRVENGEELASVMVKTPPLQDVPHSALPVQAQQSMRPSSPTTTIKSSIQSAEAKLNDARNRLTKSRRSHKAAMSKLEKEVDAFNTRLKSSSDDTKQRQKLLQAERSIRQTEDATNSITAALDDLAAIPEEETVDYTMQKEAFETQSQLLTAANETLVEAKSSAQNEVSCVRTELNTVAARKERLISRQTRLTEQHDRITQANVQGMNEKERKAAESAAKQAEQQRIEAEYMHHFNSFNTELQDLQRRTNQAWMDVQAYERQAQSQRDTMLKNAGPLTPEGNLPGTNPPQPAAVRTFNFGFQPSSFAPPFPASPETQSSPFLPFAKTAAIDLRRPRSDTNRSLGANSNYSVDFEDADPIPPMPTNLDFEGSGPAGRQGSGSSRGKNNGSPGIIGPIGLASPLRGNHSPAQGHTNTW